MLNSMRNQLTLGQAEASMALFLLSLAVFATLAFFFFFLRGAANEQGHGYDFLGGRGGGPSSHVS